MESNDAPIDFGYKICQSIGFRRRDTAAGERERKIKKVWEKVEILIVGSFPSIEVECRNPL